MDEARWELADRLFDRALEMTADEREAFLGRECGADAELRELVERLLRAAERPPTRLAEGGGLRFVTGDDAAEDEADLSGTTIDRYRIVREIGRGGMAVVYLAEREGGGFEQKVAIKLIKRGIDTDEVVRRFVRERQIMALASHPDIARLLDGGATTDGRPYFVMEYVDGEPIDTYCDRERLTVRDRLRLFLRVARVIGYAHRNLVVHRDIKPSNILVSADGDVKLLDFGIARYLGDDADEHATRTGARFLTPAWASPEQVRGQVVTTSSDVYQLGLLLFHLLTGRPPYEMNPTDPESLRRSICEEEPTRPSVAVGRRDAGPSPDEVGDARGVAPRALRGELSGDLDTIVLAALRKEPERRYASVERLADDIEAYLDGRPVSARADTFGYRLGKFVRRHTVAVAFGATLAAVLVTVAVAMSVLAGRLAVEKERANRQALGYERVAEFLVDLFAISDPDEARGNEVTAREVLDRGAERIAAGLDDEPTVQARLMDTMGRVYQNLGLYEDARRLLEAAVEIRRDHPGEDADDLAASLHHLGWLLEQSGDYGAAEPLYREALVLQRAAHGPRHEDVAGALNNLGLLLYQKGDHEAAEPLLRESLELRRELGGGETTQAADTMANLALVMIHVGRPEDAVPLMERALEIRRRELGDDHPVIATSLDTLGRAYVAMKRYDEAEPLLREALELRRRVYGEVHPEVATSLNNLASLFYLRGDWEAAAPIFRDVLEQDRATLGPQHRDVGISHLNLAHVVEKTGDLDAALELYRQALAIFVASVGDEHFLCGTARTRIGETLAALGRDDAEAERELLAGLAVTRAALGDEHGRTRGSARAVVAFYDGRGRPGSADPYRSLAEEPAEGE